VTRAPSALVAVDAGAATTAVALLGRPGDRWRLVGSLAAPAGVDAGDLLDVLAARVRAADPALADAIELRPGDLDGLPRLQGQQLVGRLRGLQSANRRLAPIHQVCQRLLIGREVLHRL